jgi:hypothetical protein
LDEHRFPFTPSHHGLAEKKTIANTKEAEKMRPITLTMPVDADALLDLLAQVVS